VAATLNALDEHWPRGERSVFVHLPGLDAPGGYADLASLADWVAPPNATLEVPAELIARSAQEPALQAALAPVAGHLCLDFSLEHGAAALNTGRTPRFIGFDAALPANTLATLINKTGALGIPLALNVASHAACKAALDAGASAVAGWFFLDSPEGMTKAATLAPSEAHTIQVLNLVRQNGDIRDIENALKQDVALSYKLLRYINSAGFGLSCEIQSFRHAVTILGYEKLNRWLSLLLAHSSKDPMAPVLLHTAITRGRLMELLGHGLVDKQEHDNLFITGAFSLLDRLLRRPLDECLCYLSLPAAGTLALQQHGGPYAIFLGIAMSAEDPHAANEIPAALVDAGIGDEEVNRAVIDALNWAHNVTTTWE
jgi:EAL and modified HD-GYP domain-containing signal transduction protein